MTTSNKIKRTIDISERERSRTEGFRDLSETEMLPQEQLLPYLKKKLYFPR